MKKGNKYYNRNDELLDSNLQVWSAVQEFNDNNEPIWFSKLVDFFKGNLTKTEVSNAQDRLEHCGVLEYAHMKIDGRWTHCWFIDKDADGWITKEVL